MKRFQFTILNLLWVTFLAAVAAGWWADHHAIQKRLESVDAQCTNLDKRLTQAESEVKLLKKKTNRPGG